MPTPCDGESPELAPKSRQILMLLEVDLRMNVGQSSGSKPQEYTGTMTSRPRFKMCVLIGLTALGGVAVGLLIFFLFHTISQPQGKSVGQLVRELEKQDTRFDKLWQTVWPCLPRLFIKRFWNLEPKPAVTIRLTAARQLKDAGPDARMAIPALVAALKDPDMQVRSMAVQALAALGPLAKPTLNDLVVFFKDRFRNTAEALCEAALALAAINPANQRAVDALCDGLNEKMRRGGFDQSSVRAYALLALEKMAKPANGVIERLIDALGDPEIDFRLQVIRSLGKIRQSTKEVVPALMGTLSSADERVCFSGVDALGNIGPEAVQAVPTLIRLLAEQRHQRFQNEEPPRPLLRQGVVLSRIGVATSFAGPAPPPPPLVGVPINRGRGFAIYRERDPLPELTELRQRIIQTLGRIGPEAKEAIPALINEYNDRTNQFRFDAALARWQIDRETVEVRRVLVEGLNHENLEARRRVAGFLAQLGVDAAPELGHALTNVDHKVRLVAVQALGALGLAARPSLSLLKEALADPKFMVRSAATNAVKRIDASFPEESRTNLTSNALPDLINK